jgi:tetratricopeptide (TPR) repeat protein
MSKPFDPYHTWLGIRPEEQPPNHYRLLGLQVFEDNPAAIENAADQRMAHLRSVQSGKRAELSQKLLNEVVAAKLCLLDRDAKTNYDAKLRQRTARAAPPWKIPVATAWSAAGAQPSSPDDVPYAEPLEAAEAVDESPVASVGGLPAQLILGLATATAIGLVIATLCGVLAWRYFSSGGGDDDIAFRHGGDRPPVTRPVRRPLPRPFPYRPTTVKPGLDDGDARESTSDGRKTTDPTGADTNGEIGTQPDSQEDQTDVSSDTTGTNDSSGQETGPASTESIETVNQRSPLTDKASITPSADDPVESPSRLAVPDRGAQAEILQQIEEIYDLAAANTDTKRLQLAQELYDLGGESPETTGERFVIYRRAMELSCEAGDADLMLASIDAIGTDYEVEVHRVRATMLERFLGKADDPTRVMAFMKKSQRAVDEAIESEAYDVAARISSMAATLCDRPVGSSDFRRGIRERHNGVEEICRRHRQVTDAQKTLESNPDDAAANLIVGRWFCLEKHDWDEGLPHLARSGDERLRTIAAQELSGNDGSASAQVSLADAWWELAAKFSEDERVPLLRRARYWYGRVDPGEISGILKLKVEKRQQEIAEQLAKLDPTAWDTDDTDAAGDTASVTGVGSASGEFNSTFAKGIAAALHEQDFDSAERLFSRCARIQPQHLPTLNNYALVSIRSRSYRRAIHLWEEAAEIAPHSSVLRHNFERFRRLADGDPIKLETSLQRDLAQLCAKVGRSSDYRSSDGWLYLPINATASDYPNSSYEDRRCFYCNGTGSVDCPARG